MSIYFRVFLPFAATIVIAMLSAWWTATSLLTNALEQRLNDQLSLATHVLAQGAFPFTPELLNQVSQLQNTEFAMLRPDGTIGLSSIDASDGDIRQLIESFEARPVSTRSGNYNLVILPLAEGRSGEYIAIAGLASLSDVQAAARSTGYWLGLLALAGIIVMAWVGHRLSSGITRPLQQLNGMAQQIAGGDRKVRADVTDIQEIRQLTLALNDMATRLSVYEEELVSKSRLANLGEITSRVAHEIRNPLTATKLQAQLLLERLQGSPGQDTAEQLLKEMQRLDLVVASTLMLSRPMAIERQPTDINEVVSDVVALITLQFKHRQINLTTNLGPIAAAPLDAARLKQVIFNLLTNAADALPEGGTIRIATSKETDSIRLIIEDSGPGMDEAATANLFDAPVSSGKAMGLGVGLVISKELVDLHDGTIQVDTSQDLGGARFTIELPVTELPKLNDD